MCSNGAYESFYVRVLFETFLVTAVVDIGYSTSLAFSTEEFSSRPAQVNRYFFCFLSHLLQRCHHHSVTVNACGHEGSSVLSLVLAYDFSWRGKFSILTPRQPMVEFYSHSHAFCCGKKGILSRIELTDPCYTCNTSETERLSTNPLGR